MFAPLAAILLPLQTNFEHQNMNALLLALLAGATWQLTLDPSGTQYVHADDPSPRFRLAYQRLDSRPADLPHRRQERPLIWMRLELRVQERTQDLEAERSRMRRILDSATWTK
jgi:hypothetical protein